MNEEGGGGRVNADYALAQLAKALASTGERAAQRLRQWQRVCAGLLEGTLRIGSRTPKADVPAWVTLEVVHGGFATGGLAAGGPLKPHEARLLETLPRPSGTSERAALNLHFLGDAGRGELERMLAEGRFRVQVPEEGALLVAAWLIRRGERERAAVLVDKMMPLIDRLRFYPVPHERPLRSASGVRVETVAETVRKLREKEAHAGVARMNEALKVWLPLYDRAVALFSETVEGSAPAFRLLAGGSLARGAGGQPLVEGGWPCRRYAPDWSARARRLLEEYRAARAANPLCRKPGKPKENLARLCAHLAAAAGDPGALSGRDVGMIRKVLASYRWRHGPPDGERLRSQRAAQARDAARPVHKAVAAVVAERLDRLGDDEGSPEVEAQLGPLAEAEALRAGARAGEPLPEPVAAKAVRCLEAPLRRLVELRLLTSSEAAAKVLPQLVARLRSAAIEDPELRRLYEAVYVAFQRRRSLLLLNLESQVRLGELPWVAAVEPWVGAHEASKRAAREALREVAGVAVGAFPEKILPNQFVTELRSLAAAAGESLAFVDELACDIFQGAFSETYLKAAKVAARLLKGSLYERYYGLPYDEVLGLDDVTRKDGGTPVSPGFARLCMRLAGARADDRWSVARNGTIIEQAQILTTHNLAVLFDGFGSAGPVDCLESARRCFRFACRVQQKRGGDRRVALRAAKNAAYAWRQMLFFLSQVPRADQEAFLAWASEEFGRQEQGFRARFGPGFAGLRAAVQGEGLGPEARRFLGWSVGKHWTFA